MNQRINRNTVMTINTRIASTLFALGLLLSCVPLAFSGSALAAQMSEEVVMILPFQINAGPEMQYLNMDLPRLIEQRLNARGIRVIAEHEMNALLVRERLASVDLAAVRTLLRKAGVTAAVYGSYSQLGESFSLDARYVSANPDEAAKPIFVEQEYVVNLLAAADDLANRVASELFKHSTISHIEVRGNEVLDPDVILLRINTKKGDFLDQQAIDRELRRIWDLGFFRDVTVDVEEKPDGLHLIYTVQEKARVEMLNINGAKELDQSDILALMVTKPGSILNERNLAADLQKIQEQYRQKGYYLAEISQSISEGRNGGVFVNVNIDEGNQLYISEVRLIGVEQMREGKVEDQLALQKRGLLSWFTGTGVLKEELLERDVAAITVFYMNNGFMDIAVSPPKVEYTQDGIIITHTISEGSRYRTGKISFRGELIDTDEELAKTTKLAEMSRKGEYFDLSAMQQDVKSLSELYSEFGYAFAAINVTPAPSEDRDGNLVIDVQFVIEKRQKVYVRSLILEGNERTRNNVILREMLLVDGDDFDGRKLGRSMERLNKLGYFETAEVELLPTPNPEEVDLRISVAEKSTGSISAGVGYSTFSRFGVSGSIRENNLWGKGYSLALQASVAQLNTIYDLTFINPRFNDTKLAVGGSLYHMKDDYYDYQKKTSGGQAFAGYPLGEYTSATVGYRLDFYNLYDFDNDASSLIRQYKGHRVASVGSLKLLRDSTDRLRPTKGTITTLLTEYGGQFLSGDDEFIKVIGEFQIYQELYKDHILHLRTRGGALFKNGDEPAPVYERFWIGGIDSIRGYRSQDIVPRDNKTNDRIGGNRMAFANFEYIWSLNDEFGINLVPFFDMGFVVDTSQDYNISKSLKKSAGLELRWRSPMGDLRFSYGWALDKGWNDRKVEKGLFEFSMGQFF